ncbi:nuclear fragile X mental retardation-interacting protein 1 [Drosophila eugracilis]|uniref:nuclear fragile X mental retardation-interacting protein 1 n=1 Tax=Drosophila eugracilis TaxID=29029 RepID=UPI0007E7D5F6|nr:nuclear fragile X mental retardation-interacting protein 1 [Drosophila eugracilis]
MEEKVQPKFVLPSPKFDKPNGANKANHLYLTPSGMTLLPRAKQPPPMYGARGSTVPAKYLAKEQITPQSSPVSVPEVSPIYHSPPRPEFCHTCGMQLANAQDMKRHMEQHESCPADNCDFSALHNILERHIEAYHITGTYKKVKKVWTDQELAAWRAERRKRFPTAANVEMARLAKEQRIKRGERLEASKSRFGNREDRQRTRPQGDHKNFKERLEPKNRKKRAKGKPAERKNNERIKRENNDKTNEGKETINQKETEKIKSNLKDEETNLCAKFGGTGNMTDYQHFKPKVQTKDNALFGLIGMYGSDSEEETETESEDQDETKDNVQSTEKDLSPVDLDSKFKSNAAMECSDYKSSQGNLCKAKPIEDAQGNEVRTSALENTSSDETPQEEHINRVNPSNLQTLPSGEAQSGSSDEAPDEEPFQRVTETIKETTSPLTQPKVSKLQTAPKRAAPKRVYGLNFKKARKQTQPNTMLSKLLESDIRHERNVLLQCVRHVCERNFFGIGQTKGEPKLVSTSDRAEMNLTCDKPSDVTPNT